MGRKKPQQMHVSLVSGIDLVAMARRQGQEACLRRFAQRTLLTENYDWFEPMRLEIERWVKESMSASEQAQFHDYFESTRDGLHRPPTVSMFKVRDNRKAIVMYGFYSSVYIEPEDSPRLCSFGKEKPLYSRVLREIYDAYVVTCTAADRTSPFVRSIDFDMDKIRQFLLWTGDVVITLNPTTMDWGTVVKTVEMIDIWEEEGAGSRS